ncbi:hypothetical protein ASE03_17835 [Kitasatospora sp. Root187]|nr:hypothetical protein ASE03_17835 [Kitasatospora sp. Root187]
MPVAGVTGRTETLVLLPDQAEARVLGGIGLGERRAAVLGAVVDHHTFKVTKCLGGDRVQALLEVALDVVDRDDDGEAGGHRLRGPFIGDVRPAVPSLCDRTQVFRDPTVRPVLSHGAATRQGTMPTSTYSLSRKTLPATPGSGKE